MNVQLWQLKVVVHQQRETSWIIMQMFARFCLSDESEMNSRHFFVSTWGKPLFLFRCLFLVGSCVPVCNIFVSWQFYGLQWRFVWKILTEFRWLHVLELTFLKHSHTGFNSALSTKIRGFLLCFIYIESRCLVVMKAALIHDVPSSIIMCFSHTIKKLV